MDKEFITITEAAEIAGYRDASTLHRAALSGKLTTRVFGQRTRLTTRAWLEDYLAGVKQRGNPRGGATS